MLQVGCSVLSQGLAHRDLLGVLACAAAASSSPKRPNSRCLVLSLSLCWLAVIHTPFWEAIRAFQKLV